MCSPVYVPGGLADHILMFFGFPKKKNNQQLPSYNKKYSLADINCFCIFSPGTQQCIYSLERKKLFYTRQPF